MLLLLLLLVVVVVVVVVAAVIVVIFLLYTLPAYVTLITLYLRVFLPRWVEGPDLL